MAGQLIDSNSAPASKSEIDFFSVPSTQVAVERSRWCIINPLTAISDSGPFEFAVNPNPQYIDLSKNYVMLKLKIKRPDPAAGRMVNLRAFGTDPVGPINLLGMTFFKQVKMFISSQLVYDSGDTYAYRSFLETELSYQQSQKSSYLESAGYSLDKPTDHLEDQQNTGWRSRAEPYEQSNTVELMGRLHIDLAQQDRLLINHVQLRFELHRHNNNFILMCFEQNPELYHVSVVDIRLMLKTVDLSPSISLAVESTLLRNTIKYPIRRVQIKVVHIPQGRRDTPNNPIFNGQIPRRLVCGLVSSDGYHGTFQTSPFNFRHYNASQISVTAGGTSIPQTPLQMNFNTNNIVQPFVHLYHTLGYDGPDKSPWVSMDEFKFGHCIYSFDLTPSCADENQWELLKEGATCVHIQFRVDVPDGGIKLIVLAEFDNLVTLDRYRNCFQDYSA